MSYNAQNGPQPQRILQTQVNNAKVEKLCSRRTNCTLIDEGKVSSLVGVRLILKRKWGGAQ